MNEQTLNAQRPTLNDFVGRFCETPRRLTQPPYNSRRFLLRLRLFVERALDLFDDRFESVRIVDRDVGQNFAVQAHAGGFQTFGEAAVSHTMRAGGGVQPLDPKITEGAFTRFAIAIGPILAFHGRVLGVTEKLRSASAITLGGFDDAFAPGPAGGRISGSWHLLLCPARAGLLHSAGCSF